MTIHFYGKYTILTNRYKKMPAQISKVPKNVPGTTRFEET